MRYEETDHGGNNFSKTIELGNIFTDLGLLRAGGWDDRMDPNIIIERSGHSLSGCGARTLHT